MGLLCLGFLFMDYHDPLKCAAMDEGRKRVIGIMAAIQ
jgi:hypothetical protein